MNWHDIFDSNFWTRVGIALFCGFIVGLERQIRGKPAGIRTCTLVCMGSMLFVQLGVAIHGPTTDATRVIGQIITGVGFLGAGLILNREGLVKGVTSAAVMWMLAAIGCAVGIDRFGIAVASAVVTVCILLGVEAWETAFKALRRGVHARNQNGANHDSD